MGPNQGMGPGFFFFTNGSIKRGLFLGGNIFWALTSLMGIGLLNPGRR